MSLMVTRVAGQHMEENSMTDEILCAFCAAPANKSCGRCGEVYCSLACQLDDWRNHRFICIPLPKLVPLPKSSNGGHFSRGTSCRTSLTSIGRVRKVAENVIAFASKDLAEAKTAESEHDEISNDDVAVAVKTCEEKITAVDECGVAVKLVESVDKLSLQSASATASSAIEPEKTSPDPRGQIIEKVDPVKVDPEAMLLPPGSAVIVVYVKDHNTVYVRQATVSHQYKQLIQKANDAGDIAERLTSRPSVGDIVLASSKLHSKYGRACIKRIEGRTAHVHFLEFGCVETVHASNIKAIPNTLRRLPCLLNEISLAGVPEVSMNADKMIDYLLNLNNDRKPLKLQYATGKVRQGSPWEIHINGELFDEATATSVNSKLIDLNVPVPLRNVISQSVASAAVECPSSSQNETELLHKGFSGENVTVLILDNSLMKLGYVSCIRESDITIFGENDERVSAYGERVAKETQFFPIVPGMLCVARSAADHRWYRAIFMQQMDKDICDVVYIDYGNMETIPLSQVRKIAEDLRFPCITVSCYIDGVTWMKRKLSKGLVQRLEELLPSYEKVPFDSIEYMDEEKTAIGRMQKIIKTLQDEELI